MADRLPLGPYRTLQTGEGVSVPYYIIPFDEEGRCSGPQTRAELVARVGAEGFSDVFVFSHGWNNGWKEAIDRYEHFITGYMRRRQELGLPVPSGFRPLLVGIFWPSKLLVGPEDRAPAIAASPETDDELVAEERAEVAELAKAVPAAQVERFYELAQSDALTEDEALELARMVADLYAAAVEEAGDDAAPTPEEIVASWEEPRPRRGDPGDLDDFGTVDAPPSADSPDVTRPFLAPQAAGARDFLAPRSIVRTLSVWQMKDRAGRVGAKGVGPLLVDLLQADRQVRVHGIGHSYGAKVILSATCAPARLPRPVESALLLQPAISHLCFAAAVPGTGRPGGYRGALDRVQKPIFATFSSKDSELRRFFHLGLRRDEDLGEAKIAADEPPSRYAALGGYGPRGLGRGGQLVPVKDAVERYNLATDGVEVYGIDASRTIGNHGDISNPSTWWMLYNLVVG